VINPCHRIGKPF
jgi:hypothetical protein